MVIFAISLHNPVMWHEVARLLAIKDLVDIGLEFPRKGHSGFAQHFDDIIARDPLAISDLLDVRSIATRGCAGLNGAERRPRLAAAGLVPV